MIFKRFKFDSVTHCLKFMLWWLYKDKTPWYSLTGPFISPVLDMSSWNASMLFQGLLDVVTLVIHFSSLLLLLFIWIICMSSSGLSLETSKFRKSLSPDQPLQDREGLLLVSQYHSTYLMGIIFACFCPSRSSLKADFSCSS